MNKQIKTRQGKVVSRGIEWVGTTSLARDTVVASMPWTQPDGTELWLATNGYTSNPIVGCHFGCRWKMPDGSVAICYAEDLADRMGIYEAGFAPVTGKGYPSHYWLYRELEAWQKHTEPCEIFVGSMADALGPWVDEAHLHGLFQAMRRAPQHRYYLLTKNAQAVPKWGPYPANVWVGVSIPPSMMNGVVFPQSTQTRLLWRALDHLLETESRGVRWLSLEPLSWNVAPAIADWSVSRGVSLMDAFQWAVIGAASSGPRTFQPEGEWVQELLDLFENEGVRVFFKGNLKLPAGGRWREEKPEHVWVTYQDGVERLVLNPELAVS